ncbi:Pentatricopeptide repeat-containing protein -mitochondrial [Striga hermonthica]|uniref:Pentatricopeptide repeat-containing protein -mitochondrial n=1 Tax=Striga hermonthica TaxID=68872 RepID=A0A9N7P2S3_STRHE|nr:Pentatricopeptide repeat-containing protein -mitochondrial [Striga hermonthica]
MLRGFSVSRVLNKTETFLRTVSCSPITDKLAPHAVPLRWHVKMYAFWSFIPNANFLVCPYFQSGGMLSLSHFNLVLRKKFCTLDNPELERSPDTDEIDDVGKVHKTVLDYSKPEYKMEWALDKLGVGLTTPLVVEVLNRLRFEEKLAFRFFTWAGNHGSYTHEPESYNKMIDILSSTKNKVRQFRIVCDLLDHMKRARKNSVPIDVLLNILRKYTEKHLTHLHKFAKKKKIRVKTQPEINAFNLLLDSLCKCGLMGEAEAMLGRVRARVSPNADTYNVMFFGWCRARDPVRGMAVLEEMVEAGHGPDCFTYNVAVDTFCRAGMLLEARRLLEFMQAHGSAQSSPTAKTYAILMAALVQNDRLDECFEILAEMIGSGCLPDMATYREIMDAMCLGGKIEAAYRFLEEMGRAGYPPDIVTYNCFLKVLCDNKNKDEAFKLYGKMSELGCVPSVQTYNILIEVFFGCGDVDGAFGIWDEMEKRGCMRDMDTYCVMVEGLFGCGENRDAVFLLGRVVDMEMKLPYKKFDLFLSRLSEIGDLRAIQRLSEHMRKFYNPAMARRFALNQRRKSMSIRGR